MTLENEIIDNHVKFRMGKAYDSTFDAPQKKFTSNTVSTLAFIDIGNSNSISPSHFETRIKKVGDSWDIDKKFQQENKKIYGRTATFINTIEKFNSMSKEVPRLVGGMNFDQ